MKPTRNKILVTLSLLVIAGALVFTTSCGPKKYKIDDTTVLPFKDKAELDKLLDLPILPEYTIEDYYTKKDFLNGDEQFVVCCKFLEEVPPAKIQEILAQVDSGKYERWYTFDLGKENNMRLFFYLDTTFTPDRKKPDFLGDRIHVDIEMRCREKDSWKGFEVVFRNDRSDNSVVNRDTLSKLLGVEFPPVTETKRSDEYIYFTFDTIPSEEFYQALKNAPHWSVTELDVFTCYDYDYDDGNYWITAHITKGEPDLDTHFEFSRYKSIESIGSGDVIDLMKRGMSSIRDKKSKSK